MKKVMFVCLIISAFGVNAQKVIKTIKVSDYSTHILGDTFEGVIFEKQYSNPYLIKDSKSFTPSSREIEIAENLILKGIDDEIKRYPKSRGAIFVKQHFKEYLHQYFGRINEKNEKVIFVNCFRKNDAFFTEIEGKNTLPRWLKQRATVNDGGYGYWRIMLNLKTNSASMFGTNGFA